MIYQVRANLYFDSEDEARDFYHDCDLAFAKSTIVHPTEPNAEFSRIELIENHHDESPTAPCLLLAGKISTAKRSQGE